MFQKKPFFPIVFCLVFILGISNTSIVFASTTDGTIDSTNKYAWGENIGWLNFGTSGGDVHVTDSGLTGYAWSENYGWINLNANGLSGGSVTNNGEGVLGGNAWSEGLGWIDFTGVTIDTSGVFSGYATIENDSSQISFNCSNTSSCGASDFKVSTDWRPISVRTTGGGGGGRGSILPPVPAEEIIGSGVCPVNLIITDNMKRGDRDGRYSYYNRGIVTQVAILQAHINRILAAQYNMAAGPVDGIFGPLTKRGVQRLQTALNIIVKPNPPLVIDGIVGPFTKTAINNSCGFLNQPNPPTTSAPTYFPSGSVSAPQNVPEVNQAAPQNTKSSLITESVNYISAYIIQPVIKTIVDVSSAIKTTLINWWQLIF